MTLNPARSFEEATHSFSRHTLKFESLAPGEQVTIEIMAINAELPLLTAVRCDEAEGKLINMQLQRRYSPWVGAFILTVLAAGLVSLVYLGISAVEWLASSRS